MLCRLLTPFLSWQVHSRLLQLTHSAFPFKYLFSKVLSLVKGFSLLLSFKQVYLHKSDLLYLHLLLSVLGHCNTNLSTSPFSALPQSAVWWLCIDTRTRADQPIEECILIPFLTSKLAFSKFFTFSDNSLQHKQKKYHNDQLQNDRLLSRFAH